jgi:hypothetical protein
MSKMIKGAELWNGFIDAGLIFKTTGKLSNIGNIQWKEDE